MKISTFPFYFQRINKPIFKILNNFENTLIENKNIKIKKPVFISGCPRSGTTILTEILNNTGNFGSFLYEDMPYYKIPIIWNFISKNFRKKNLKKIQRVHGDNIYYNYNSPDAFEELIWSDLLDDYELNFSQFIDETYHNHELLIHLKYSIKKILHLRNANRYLSKGNYNLFRFRFLNKNLYEPRFIFVIRDPIQTCISHSNVHNKFINEAKKNKNFDKALEYLCHFEFGNRRRVLTICQDKNKIKNLWESGDNFLGYLNQWNEIHKFVYDNYLIDNFKNNIFIFNYEDFKKEPLKILKKLFNFIEINFDLEKLNIQNIKFKDDIVLDFKLTEKLKKISYDLFNKITVN